MNKENKNLPSEQLPNDGGWHWDKSVRQTNDRLGQIGKHGKRAKIKVTPKPGKPISVQFSLPVIGQQSKGLNLQLNKANLAKAEELCSLITGQLVAGTFTMDWFYSLVGKTEKVTQPEKALTCGEMLEQYKTHYFKQRKNDKNPDGNWINYYRHTEATLLKNKNKVIDLKIIKEIIECTENNSVTRKLQLCGIVSLLKYFDNNDYKQVIKRYKTENNPKPKQKHIPTDVEIDHVYQTGFEPKKYCRKDKIYRYAQWQFLYSLLATYGLRIHEAWNIKNWNETVVLKAGDWVAIDSGNVTDDDDDDNGFIYQQLQKDETIPAILDPENQDYLLCIGHDTKTGYRVAFPLSPSGVGRECDWIKRFNIVQPMNLPDIENPLEYVGQDMMIKCTRATKDWFNPDSIRRKNKRNNTPNKSSLRYGFTAHALRHAYNIRGHKLGLNQKMLADSLGHGLQMNSTTYMRHEQTSSKIQGIKQEISKYSRETLEVDKLRDRNKYLEDENNHLKLENEKLRTKLAMYEAIEEQRNKE